jgi:hypothetical protein
MQATLVVEVYAAISASGGREFRVYPDGTVLEWVSADGSGVGSWYQYSFCEDDIDEIRRLGLDGINENTLNG